jgi:hypothetical protein
VLNPASPGCPEIAELRDVSVMIIGKRLGFSCDDDMVVAFLHGVGDVGGGWGPIVRERGFRRPGAPRLGPLLACACRPRPLAPLSS